MGTTPTAAGPSSSSSGEVVAGSGIREGVPTSTAASTAASTTASTTSVASEGAVEGDTDSNQKGVEVGSGDSGQGAVVNIGDDSKTPAVIPAGMAGSTPMSTGWGGKPTFANVSLADLNFFFEVFMSKKFLLHCFMRLFVNVLVSRIIQLAYDDNLRM